MHRPDRTASNDWISAATPRPEARARLFCFSYAGAGTAAYRGWGDAAPEALEVCTIQLPGRENRLRETPVSSLSELVRTIVQAVQPLTSIPYALFGHSLGAIVAFETARELRRLNAPQPEALFVSASRAPQLPWPHPPVRHLDDVALLTEVHRRYGSVPEVIIADAELRELLTPALRADMSLVETYDYQEEVPFTFPLMVFGGNADHMVSHEALAQWETQTLGTFRRRILPGNHLFLQTGRQALLDDIATTLGVHPSLAASGHQ
jgi:medium-chain acyl-[acyl-carrier-protein] hydrolase